MRPPTFDAFLLALALAKIPPDVWPQPSDIATNGAHHRYRRVGLVAVRRWKPLAEVFRFVLDEFKPVHTATLSWIEPGGYIIPHHDAGPYWERWHVPVQPAGTMNGEGAVDGVPFRVEHWLRHEVSNDTDRHRFHLVIDRDIRVDVPSLPFHIYMEDSNAE